VKRDHLALLWTALLVSTAVPGLSQSKVPIWTRFEAVFESQQSHENPVQQVELQVNFVSPSGKKQTVLGFWDGAKTWRVRFSPDEIGVWSYSTSSSDPSDKGLQDKSGKFECVPYTGERALYEHGAIRLSPDRHYLVHADGAPFFWLACTGWNAALLSTDEEWKTYLNDRRNKRFTAIQFVATAPWRAAPTDRDGNVAFTGKEAIAIQPAFFQRMDRKFDLLNETGLVGLPVLLWAIRADKDPGLALPENQAALLVRYLVARYGAHHVIWILGGDANYSGERAKRWYGIGREGLKFNPGRLTTLHPQGMQWPWDDFRDQAWLDILVYQSGHGNSDASRKWNCVGPPATKWRDEPHRPVINAEPNYEGHLSYEERKPFQDYHVRRAAYWSLLASPTAGLTYGAHGIWSWEEKPAVPLDHPRTGEARPWKEAIGFPGSMQMKLMRDLFERLPWWELRPADEIVLDRPDDPTFLHYIKAAKTTSGEWAVVYLPDNEGVTIDVKPFGGEIEGVWFDPRTGKFSKTIEVPKDATQLHFKVPGHGDWVLILHKKR